MTKKEPKIFKGKNKELSKNNVYSVQQERNHIIPFSRSKTKKIPNHSQGCQMPTKMAEQKKSRDKPNPVNQKITKLIHVAVHRTA